MSGLTIGMFLVGVCLTKIFLGLRRDRSTSFRSWELERACEEAAAPGRQNIEDFRMERGIRRAALDAYMDWLKAESNHKIFLWANPGVEKFMPGPIHLIIFDTREIGIYTIYHEATAKYKNANINELISVEFRKLKEKHKENELNRATDMAPDATT